MRNDYTAYKKAKKVAKSPPLQKRIQIRKPIIMPPIVIVPPFFVL